MSVSILTASLLALWLLTLSLRVISLRRAAASNSSDEHQQKLKRAIRGQANLTEYAPVFLLLLFLAESHSDNQLYLAAVAALFVLGRLLHGIVFAYMSHNMLLRVGGTVLTLTSIALLALGNLLLLL